MYFLVTVFVILNPSLGMDDMPQFISYRTVYPHPQVCNMMLPDAKTTAKEVLAERFPDKEIKHEVACITKEQIEQLNNFITTLKVFEEKSKV